MHDKSTCGERKCVRKIKAMCRAVTDLHLKSHSYMPGPESLVWSRHYQPVSTNSFFAGLPKVFAPSPIGGCLSPQSCRKGFHTYIEYRFRHLYSISSGTNWTRLAHCRHLDTNRARLARCGHLTRTVQGWHAAADVGHVFIGKVWAQRKIPVVCIF